MAIVKPFKAIRPTRDKAFFVASRSYEEYSKEELKAVLQYNPFSFLHIINPGFKFEKNIKGKERFGLVHNRYLEFLEENIFQKDDEPSFYLYQIEKDDFKSLGFFCACSVDDYRNNVIKKHEDTIQDREELFADYLHTVGFNAEPVLMTYEDNELVDEIFQRKIERKPEYDFTTTDRVNHKLWKISYPEGIEKLEKAFGGLNALYIADGHHRSASSSLLADLKKSENDNHTGEEAYNYFMAYLIPESQMRVFEFNRMVKDLNGLSKKHEFSMYLEGEFYTLHLRKTNHEFTDALSKLDTQILYKTILEPILGITDLRNDKRICYGYGKNNLIQMKDSVDSGNYAVGFSMVPTTIEEIKAIADASLVMPPKSTYIEPKLRSGLAIYEL